MVGIAQLVRALVCGTRGRGFKSHYPPKENKKVLRKQGLILCAKRNKRSLITRMRNKTKCRRPKASALFVFFEGSTDNTGITSEASTPIIHPKKTKRSCASKAFYCAMFTGDSVELSWNDC